jgi:GNAT superfamily N-acetyltransferase
MQIIDLTDEQVSTLENQLAEYDGAHMKVQLDGHISLGIMKDGQLVAGLDGCMTAYRILYASTVFVKADYRRCGYGKALMAELEQRARAMGANMIRLDIFDWQGKAFYEALGYEIVGSYENRQDSFSEYFFLKRL